MLTELTWEAVGATKREELLSSIPPEWIIPADISPPHSQTDVTSFPQTSGWFTPPELEITGSTASEILAKTTTGIWSAEAVTRAFCKRAAAAHQLVCHCQEKHQKLEPAFPYLIIMSKVQKQQLTLPTRQTAFLKPSSQRP